MSEWKEYKLEDVCDAIYSGGTPSSMVKDYWNGSLPWLSSGETSQRYIFSTEKCITQEGVDNSSTRYAYKDSTVVASAGQGHTRGQASLLCINTYVNQSVIVLKPNEKCLNPYFLYYNIDNRYNELRQLSDGTSTRGSLSGKILKELPIKIPSLVIQSKIASILKSFDDKIEVNKRISDNLEQQAQALFKHWFVDFAPFKDGKFVESELGMIPEGWRVGTYDEIIQDTISGDWGKEKPEGNYTHKVACIRGCDFQDVKMGLRGKTPERYILEKNYDSKHFNDKDVLVEISGGTATVSTGRICPVSQLLIDKYNGDIVCTNFCRLVRPCVGYSSYLYYSWKYKYDKKVMFGYENGTSGIKNFSIKDFTSREPLIIPRLSDLQIFEDMIEHIHTHIQDMGSESAKLASLRDTLLPRLMSGELKVN